MTLVETATPAEMKSRAQAAKDQLDKHAFETIQWHFHDSTGSPFWLEKKKGLKFDPLKDVKCFADIQKFPLLSTQQVAGLREPGTLLAEGTPWVP